MLVVQDDCASDGVKVLNHDGTGVFFANCDVIR